MDGTEIKGKPTLILTVGLPRSGKSTWARQTGHFVVDPDSIRLAIHGKPFVPELEPKVWEHARIAVVAAFFYGHKVVVLDSCSVTHAEREKWRDPRWDTQTRVFPTEPAECMNRAVASGQDYLIPVIAKMHGKFEHPGSW